MNYLDANGLEIFEGDKVELEIKKVGKGLTEVVMHEGGLKLFNESNGYFPLSKAVERDDIILTVITP
jgi:hypothetical protein